MSAFAYVPASSLDEALSLLARHGDDAHLLAGGTSFVLLLRQGLLDPGVVVGLRSVPGLDTIEVDQAGRLRIGAMATLSQIERDPLVGRSLPVLREVVRRVATIRVRNQATIGGNLVHADPAQDPPPVLLALDAAVEVAGPSGRRILPLNALFVDVIQTSLAPGEIVTALVVPLPPPQARFATVKFLPRTVDDFATVSVAVRVDTLPDGRVGDVRIALGAVAPVPLRAEAAEDAIRGRVPDDRLIDDAADLVLHAVDPVDDVRGSADYKREMARVWTRRALGRALGWPERVA